MNVYVLENEGIDDLNTYVSKLQSYLEDCPQINTLIINFDIDYYSLNSIKNMVKKIEDDYNTGIVESEQKHYQFQINNDIILTIKRLDKFLVCDVPDEVTKIKSIDDYVKNDIRGIRLPNTVTEIMDFAFNDCSSLVYANLNNRLKTIGDSAFRNTCIKKIIIPNSVTSICNKAFENCTTLESINIIRVFNHGKPIDNLKIIGDNAFENCSFNTFTMPMSVTHIGVEAFKDCTTLTNINFNYRYTFNGKHYQFQKIYK